jgi:small subunit ribosomal protein S16
VAVKIKLQRLGKIRHPQYRIVVADARTKRDGKVIEAVGKYHPKEDPSFIEVNSERVQYWLGVGAQPTEPVAVILKLTGDWQKHKGLPPPEKPLLVKAPRPDKRQIFEAAALETAGEAKAEATTPRKKAAKKAPARAEHASAEPAKAEATKAEPARAEPTKAEPARAEATRAEPAKAEPAKAEPAKAEPTKAEPAKTEAAKAEPAKTEPAKTEPATEAPPAGAPAGAGADTTES